MTLAVLVWAMEPIVTSDARRMKALMVTTIEKRKNKGVAVTMTILQSQW